MKVGLCGMIPTIFFMLVVILVGLPQQEPAEHRVRPEHLAHRVPGLEHLAVLAPLVPLEHREVVEHQEALEHRAQVALQVQVELQVVVDHQEPAVRVEHRVVLAHQVRAVQVEQAVLLALLVHQERVDIAQMIMQKMKLKAQQLIQHYKQN